MGVDKSLAEVDHNSGYSGGFLVSNLAKTCDHEVYFTVTARIILHKGGLREFVCIENCRT